MFKVAKIIASFASGGWYALVGALGAFVGEAGADVIKATLDYVWLEDETRCLVDHPEWKDYSIPKRFLEVLK